MNLMTPNQALHTPLIGKKNYENEIRVQKGNDKARSRRGG